MFQEHGVCPMLFLTLFKIFLSEYIWITLTIRITWRHRSCHRGRHAKIFRWTNLRPTTDVLQAIYGLTHNIGIGDKQKSCVMCVKFSKEWKTILHIVLLKFLWPLTNSSFKILYIRPTWLKNIHIASCASRSDREVLRNSLYVNDIEQEAVIAMNICILN